MIAKQYVHPASGGLRFALQSHQEIHHFARFGAAVEQIAQAHHMCVAGRPSAPFVHDTNFTQ